MILLILRNNSFDEMVKRSYTRIWVRLEFGRTTTRICAYEVIEVLSGSGSDPFNFEAPLLPKPIPIISKLLHFLNSESIKIPTIETRRVEPKKIPVADRRWAKSRLGEMLHEQLPSPRLTR